MSLLKRLPARAALAGVAVVLAIGVAWQLGVQHGRGSGLSDGLGDGLGGESASVGLRSGADPAQTLDILQRERDSATAATIALRDRLAEAERVNAEDAAELALYRRIGAEAQRTGLGVDSVELRAAAGGDALEITLVQARGRDRVAGTLGVSVLSSDDPQRRVQLAPDEGDAALSFDLRFFETVTVPVGEIVVASGIEPDQLAISVKPASGKHPAFVEIREWDTIVGNEAAQ